MVNITALVAAAAVINIIDFQGRAFDLANGDPGDFVPIQAFEFVNNLNQQWLMQGQGTFSIINSGTGSFLSYPSAVALGSGGTIIRQQAMAHPKAPTTWNLLSAGGSGVRLQESVTQFVLTSWPANPQTQFLDNPLTLEILEQGNSAQVFQIETA